MNWNLKLYNKLVNQVPGIREKYQTYRQKHGAGSKLTSWAYLMILNFEYHILHRSAVGDAACMKDDKDVKLLFETSESASSLLEPPSKLAERLSKADVVSFDVFDTLILRPFQKPSDLFFLVGQRLEYPDFKRIRQEAEMAARREKEKRSGSTEVSFEEIWKKLEQTSGISCSEGMDTEWKAELKVCYANPYFVEVISKLKKSGKKLIVCSDMYLGEKRIRQLLEKCGYPEFDEYFVSCDCGMSKSEGSLYDLIKTKYGGSLSYIHVGDNRHSDYDQALKKGFQAVLYHNVNDAGKPFRPQDMSPLTASMYAGIVNGHLHNGLTTKSIPYEFGFIYGGLFVTGYCQFIHDYVERHKADRILFLARDGDILHKAYLAMYPEEKDRCAYVYWSRLAATKMCAARFKHRYIQSMITYKVNHGYTISDIMKTMQLDDMLEEFLQWVSSGYNAESLFDRKLAGLLQEFVEANWEKVLAHYSEEIEEGRKYFAKILHGASNAVAVDVGWVGSGALALRYLIQNTWKFNCSLTGIIAGTCGGRSPDHEISEVEVAAGRLVSYLYSPNHNRDLWKVHDATKGHNLIIELLLSSNTPSFRGFRKTENGTYSFNTQKEQIDSDAIQEGILDFVRKFSVHPFKSMTISGRDAAAPIAVLYHNDRWVQKVIEDSKINVNIE